MPNTEQIGDILFKKLHGLGTTQSGRHIFNEPITGRPFVSLDQIWGQSNLIPNTAPTSSSGVIQKVTNHQLSLVIGTNNSFTGELLKDVIPFNWGDGSYNYSIVDSLSNQIPFGKNDWTLDTEAGILMFNSGVPDNMPPSISFYRYTGIKGVTGNGGASSNADTLDGYHASNFVSGAETGNFVTTSQTGDFYPRSNPSGFITGVNLTNYVTKAETGVLSNADTLDSYHASSFVLDSETGAFYPASNPAGYISTIVGGTENYFVKWGAEGLTTGVIYQDGEKVSIGSLAPPTNFHVEGGITSYGYARGTSTNIALNKQTYQIGDYSTTTVSSKAVDGNTDTYSKTDYHESGAWWEIDLGAVYKIERVVHKRPIYFNHTGEPILDESGYYILDESGEYILSETGGPMLEASGIYLLQSAEGFGVGNEAVNPITIGSSTGGHINSYNFAGSGLNLRYLRLFASGYVEAREFEVYSYVSNFNRDVETSNFYGPVNLAIDSGNVGIKTSNPQADLDVNGIVRASGLQGPSGFTGNYIDLANRILTGGDWAIQGIVGGTPSAGGVSSIEGLSGIVDISGLGNITISTGDGIVYISGESQALTDADTLDGYHASNFVSGSETGIFITTGQTGDFYPSNNPSGFITAAQAGGVTSIEGLSGIIDASGLGNITISTGNGVLYISGSSQALTDADTLDGYHASNFISGSQTGNFVTTGDSRNLRFGGNVGIGVSPISTVKLYVSSPNSADIAGAFYAGSDLDDNAKTVKFRFGAAAASYYAITDFVVGHSSNGAAGDSYFAIQNRTAGTMTEYLRLTKDGYFGINTTSPTNPLSVSGTSRMDGNVTINGTVGGNNNLVLTSMTGVLSNADTLDSFHSSYFVNTGQTGQFYPTSNPAGYITSAQIEGGIASIEGLSGIVDVSGLGNITISTGVGVLYISGTAQSLTDADTLDGYHASNFVSGAETGYFGNYFVNTGQTGAFSNANTLDGYHASNFISGSQTGNFVTTGDSRNLGFLGNIGIGTYPRTIKLYVISPNNGDTAAGFYAGSPLDDVGKTVKVALGAPALSYYGISYLVAGHSTDGVAGDSFFAIEIRKSGSFIEGLRLTKDGYLGLNTNSPAARLDVLQPWSTVPTIRLGDVITNATQKLGRLSLRHYTNAEEDVTMFMADSDGTHNTIKFGGGTSYGNCATRMSFLTAANTTTTFGTEVMTISGSNVGINTTIPAVKLQVESPNSADIVAAFYAGSAANETAKTAKIELGGKATSYYGRAHLIAGHSTAGNVGDSYFSIETRRAGNMVEAIRITKDGYLGVGITAPINPIETNGSIVINYASAGDGGLFITSGQGTYSRCVLGIFSGEPHVGLGTASNIRDIYIRRNAGHLAFGFSTSNTEKFRMTTGGFFGINTANPTNPLSVSGTSRMDGNVTINGTVTGNNNLVLTGMTGILSNADTLDSFHASYFVNTGQTGAFGTPSNADTLDGYHASNFISGAQTGQFYPRNGNPEGYLTSGDLPAGTIYAPILLPSGILDGTYTEGIDTVQKANVYIDWTSGESFHYIFKSSGVNWTVESCPKIYFIHKNVITGKKITVAISNTGVIFMAPNGVGEPVWSGEAPFNSGIAWENSYSQTYPYQPSFSNSMSTSSDSTTSISDIFSFMCFGKGIYGKVEISAAAIPGQLLL